MVILSMHKKGMKTRFPFPRASKKFTLQVLDKAGHYESSFSKNYVIGFTSNEKGDDFGAIWSSGVVDAKSIFRKPLILKYFFLKFMYSLFVQNFAENIKGLSWYTREFHLVLPTATSIYLSDIVW